MENYIRRLPFVGAMIFYNLDDQILAKSKEISREISKFIKNERFYWIRIIQKYNEKWRAVINKVAIEDLKELATESEKSYWIKIIEGFIEEYYGEQEAWGEVIDNIPINVIKQLATALEQFFDVNQWKFGFGPLEIALEFGNLELCEYVISKTTNKNPADDNGYTPLHQAAIDGHLVNVG